MWYELDKNVDEKGFNLGLTSRGVDFLHGVI
jgi:hypothetical protein